MAKQFSECVRKNCGGVLIADDWESDGEEVWREVRCEDCGWEYQEVYKFDHNETIGDLVVLDNKGKEIPGTGVNPARFKNLSNILKQLDK